MSGKVMLTLQDLHVLAATAERNGTQHGFPAIALQWAAAAQVEIDRLRATLALERRAFEIERDTLRARVAELEERVPSELEAENDYFRARGAELESEYAELAKRASRLLAAGIVDTLADMDPDELESLKAELEPKP